MLRRGIFLQLALALAPLLASQPESLIGAVDSVGITVSDLDRSVAFYTRILGFEKVTETEQHGDALERLTGLFPARARTARLRLRNEHIELTEFLAPAGRPFPPDTRSNDRWFQHIAIITSDMERAYQHLRKHKVRHASPGPQRLPDWNRNAAGIQAFYFRDPDGHFLEILAFPEGKGDARWRARHPLFLGIDHTAIVVGDTDASLRFYRDLLGLQVAGGSENYGPEQERLNAVFGARLRITGLRAANGFGIEFLEYLAPDGGRPYPSDATASDLLHWHTKLLTTRLRSAEQVLRENRAKFVSSGIVTLPQDGITAGAAILIRDPDGHAIQIAQIPE